MKFSMWDPHINKTLKIYICILITGNGISSSPLFFTGHFSKGFSNCPVIQGWNTVTDLKRFGALSVPHSSNLTRPFLGTLSVPYSSDLMRFGRWRPEGMAVRKGELWWAVIEIECVFIIIIIIYTSEMFREHLFGSSILRLRMENKIT